MVRMSFLTRSEAEAIRLAGHLHDQQLLLFITIEDHSELRWEGGGTIRTELVHLSGMTKALLYRTVELHARELLGDALVRTWAEAVTALDAESTAALMQGTRAV